MIDSVKKDTQKLETLSPEERRELLARFLQKKVKTAPLSFAQERLWFLDRLETKTAAVSDMNIPAAARLLGQVDVPTLHRSLNEVVRRHEILRTTFAITEGQPYQVIAPALLLPLPFIDLTHIPAARQDAEAQRLLIQTVRQPLDLSAGPLLQARLFKLAPGEHIFFVSMHHIISDGWSETILIRELTSIYTAYAQKRPSPLPELPLQYAEFARWQRDWLQGETLENLVAYWRTQLADIPPPKLPTDRPHLLTMPAAGAIEMFSIEKELVARLETLAQQENATLYMLLLAALQTLLHRYTGQKDISVGTLIANRNRRQIQGLIGFFVNTLVLRTSLQGNPTFRELIGRVRQAALDAYAHQDLPFERLLQELQPIRGAQAAPLFRAMLILQNLPRTTIQLPGVEIQRMAVYPGGRPSADLALFLGEVDGELSGFMEYDARLFDAETVRRLLQQFRTLLNAAVTTPDSRLTALPLMTAVEERRLVVEMNQTRRGYPNGCTVVTLFEAQVRRAPDTEAVSFAGETLTYGELNARANRLAHYLRCHGVGPEVAVGIFVEQSLEMVVGTMATLKSGGAYVPLDVMYPQERLAFLLADAHVTVLLTQEKLLAHIPHQEVEVICLDAEWWSISQQCEENLTSAAVAENLAYVIYTSGSTGQPKGTMITHGSLVNAYSAWEETYGLGTAVTCHLQMANFSFDVFTGDMVRALCSGGKLVLCPRDILLDADKMVTLMRQEGVNGGEFVPVVAKNPTQHLNEIGQRLDFMRLVVVGSDTWYVQERQQLQHVCTPETQLVNSYGLSEATIDSTYFVDTAVPLSGDRFVPIGRPFPNTSVYILDASMQPVPVGVSGELYVGGKGIGRGYLNQPRLTAERFVPNPFVAESENRAAMGELLAASRLYRTGDLARYLSDGNIEFLGRIDHQVKVRGFRIELGEIESLLNRHSAVRESVALMREDEPGDQRLVAYVVTANSQLPNNLRDYLQRRLPAYMVPTAFVLLKALPLLPNGKVNRGALPAPDGDSLADVEEYVPPEGYLEEKLVEIWSEVLKVKRIGVYDDFFNLGGHSLMATQVIFKINKEFRLNLSVRSIFEESTIAGLAVLIEETLLEEIEN